jgi:hypothetical protein
METFTLRLRANMICKRRAALRYADQSRATISEGKF